MQLVTFVAESAADAATQVRERLGPLAIVVQVRPLAERGRDWFGRKRRPRFEVIAYRPEPASGSDPAPGPAPAASPARLDVVVGDDVTGSVLPADVSPAGGTSFVAAYGNAAAWRETAPSDTADGSHARTDPAVASASDESTPVAVSGQDATVAIAAEPETRSALSSAGWRPGSWPAETEFSAAPAAAGNPSDELDPVEARRVPRDEHPGARSGGGGWRVGGLLEASGFLPSEAQRVVDSIRLDRGDRRPSGLGREIELAKRTLNRLWRSLTPVGPGDLHVLIGAPGVGKTTCLSKWLTQVALGQGHPVRVWRLDGQRANTSDALSVYCDVLGVGLERRWDVGEALAANEVGFVDLPGTDWRDPDAVIRLGGVLTGFRRCRVHLVLNGAYDVPLMLDQIRAFGVLPVEDLIVTHLDEESRWGKLWNLVLGTNFTPRYLSAGQNVPGDFHEATPEVLSARQFPA